MSYVLKNVSIRLVEEPPLLSDTKILKPQDAIALVGDKLRSSAREMVCLINLNTKGKPISMSVISMGSLNASIADPKEIFKAALLSNAHSIVLMHNHPSGDLTPSVDDIKMTDRLIKCGKFMNLPVWDHVIVGNPNTAGYYSLKEMGYFEDNRPAQEAEVTTRAESLHFERLRVAEPEESIEPQIIRSKEDAEKYLCQLVNCEVGVTDYIESAWFRNLPGYECVDDDVAGIIGTTKEGLLDYVWNHRKLINKALRGECSYTVKKKDMEPAIRKGRSR